ncbi:hypothetical protein LIER_14982 [Lithospermum erythrorhizon]|uniref:WRKY domain-containing protein n=1 Tax=Lithospermum erythrorhizon TaxID=34254 RepID=A0AAV3Q1J1_LITER
MRIRLFKLTNMPKAISNKQSADVKGWNLQLCYFRCTHKFDQGCRAVKQVQKVDDQERSKYHTTYFGHHTCKNLTTAPQIIISDSEETKEQNTNMICFQEKANQVPFSAVEMKQESKGEAQSDDVTDNVSSNVPNKFMWNDVGGTGSSLPVEMEYYPKMEFFHDHQEVASRSLGDLDIKTFNDSTHLFQW